MEVVELRTGDKINIYKEIQDGDAAKVVKAFLTFKDGTPLSTIVLPSTGGSSRFDNSFIMPSAAELLVKVQTFENDGNTPSSLPITSFLVRRQIITVLGKSIIGFIDSGRESIRSPKFTATRGEDGIIPVQFIVKETGRPFDIDGFDRIEILVAKSTGGFVSLSTDQDLIGVKERSEILTVGDINGSLNGKTFIVSDKDGLVGIWFDIGNIGTPTPALALAANRNIKVVCNDPNETPADIAGALDTNLTSDSEFNVISKNDNKLILENVTVGARIDIDSGDTGFTVSVVTQGSNPFNPKIDVEGETIEGRINAIYNVTDSNSFSLGIDQDIKAIFERNGETSIIQMRNILNVED